MNKFCKGSIKVLAFLLALIVVDNLIGQMVRPITFTDYLLHDLKQIDEAGENVDVLILGSSHAERALIPAYMEAELGADHVINAATADQPLLADEYVLRDAISKYRLKTVILDISSRTVYEDEILDGQLEAMGKMTFSSKVKYFLRQPDLIRHASLQFWAYRYRDKFNHGDFVRRADVIRNGYEIDQSRGEIYVENGYVASFNSFIQGNAPIVPDQTRAVLTRTAVKELQRIDDLCRENGISLYLVSFPLSMSLLYSTEYYQDKIDVVQQWAQDHGRPYHNLSLLKGREEFLDDTKMKDPDHVNVEGAKEVTDRYCDILQRTMEGQDTSELFYGNLDDLKKDVHRAPAVEATIIPQEAYSNLYHVTTRCLANENTTPLYRILLTTEGGQTQTISDWSNETEYDLDLSAYGEANADRKLRIECVSSVEDTVSAFQEYSLKDIEYYSNDPNQTKE